MSNHCHKLECIEINVYRFQLIEFTFHYEYVLFIKLLRLETIMKVVLQNYFFFRITVKKSNNFHTIATFPYFFQ